MLFIILLSLLMMVLALLLFIPCTYTVRIEIRAPFRLYCRVSWLQHGLYWSWDYTFGQRPQRELYLGWHAWPPQAAPAEANAEADPVPDAALSDDLLREVLSDADTRQAGADEEAGWWRPYLISEEFLVACLQLIRRVLHHSRIRRFTLEGTLGLPQPHQTGMTAGFLYTVAPRQAATLQFNFLEEIYDCEAVLAGTIYPGALVLYAAVFMTTRPLRKLLRAILQRRRDTDHGQKRIKKQPGNDI